MGSCFVWMMNERRLEGLGKQRHKIRWEVVASLVQYSGAWPRSGAVAAEDQKGVVTPFPSSTWLYIYSHPVHVSTVRELKHGRAPAASAASQVHTLLERSSHSNPFTYVVMLQLSSFLTNWKGKLRFRWRIGNHQRATAACTPQSKGHSKWRSLSSVRVSIICPFAEPWSVAKTSLQWEAHYLISPGCNTGSK